MGMSDQQDMQEAIITRMFDSAKWSTIGLFRGAGVGKELLADAIHEIAAIVESDDPSVDRCFSVIDRLVAWNKAKKAQLEAMQ
jgi:F0F1-type ATP synthase beta subunit